MKLKKGEKGFTLIELIIGISIAVFVVGAASMAIITMMRLSPRNSDWAIALRQVQNAGWWISRDVQMSQGDIDIGTGATYLTLTLPQDQNPAHNKQIVYEFQDMSDGLKRLSRNDQVTQIMVAEYISIPTSPIYDPVNHTLTFTIEATSGNVPPVFRTYEATQRVPAAPP
jgi:type II secretory pathway pseudopilin PulG